MNKILYGFIAIMLSQVLAFNASAAKVCRAISPSFGEDRIEREKEFSNCLGLILSGEEKVKDHPWWMRKLESWLNYWQEQEKEVEKNIKIYPEIASTKKKQTAIISRLQNCDSMIYYCLKLMIKADRPEAIEKLTSWVNYRKKELSYWQETVKADESSLQQARGVEKGILEFRGEMPLFCKDMFDDYEQFLNNPKNNERKEIHYPSPKEFEDEKHEKYEDVEITWDN